MPNWVEQDLVVVGPREDMERFVSLAVEVPPRQEQRQGWLPVFAFNRVCPLRPDEERSAEGDPEDGLILQVTWSHTAAYFFIHSAWQHPQHFYLVRLLRDWPSLSFCCAVNEELNQFGGLIAGIDGAVTDLVWDYDSRYNRRSHAGRISSLKRRFGRVLRDGRPFQVFLRFRPRPLRVHYGVDATFDQDGWPLYLRTEAECRRLIRNRPDAIVLRQSRASGQWRRVSRLCKGHIWKGR